jgi:hypothetical protein
MRKTNAQKQKDYRDRVRARAAPRQEWPTCAAVTAAGYRCRNEGVLPWPDAEGYRMCHFHAGHNRRAEASIALALASGAYGNQSPEANEARRLYWRAAYETSPTQRKLLGDERRKELEAGYVPPAITAVVPFGQSSESLHTKKAARVFEKMAAVQRVQAEMDAWKARVDAWQAERANPEAFRWAEEARAWAARSNGTALIPAPTMDEMLAERRAIGARLDAVFAEYEQAESAEVTQGSDDRVTNEAGAERNRRIREAAKRGDFEEARRLANQ